MKVMNMHLPHTADPKTEKPITVSPLWFQWLRTFVFLLLFCDYTRLVVTTDVPPHRVVVMLVWAVLAGWSLVMLLRTLRKNSKVPAAERKR
jgi:hypothetical protein